MCAVLLLEHDSADYRTNLLTRSPGLHTAEDAKVIDTFRSFKDLDSKGRLKPEIFYGSRKTTAWMWRSGFPEVSKHGIHRLMHDGV